MKSLRSLGVIVIAVVSLVGSAASFAGCDDDTGSPPADLAAQGDLSVGDLSAQDGPPGD